MHKCEKYDSRETIRLEMYANEKKMSARSDRVCGYCLNVYNVYMRSMFETK